MIQSLDAPTVSLCSAVICFTFGTLFCGLWWGRRRESHLGYWAAAAFLHGGAIAGFLAAPHPLPLIPSTPLYAALGCSLSAMVAGVLRFERRPVRAALLVALAIPAPLLFIVVRIAGVAGTGDPAAFAAACGVTGTVIASGVTLAKPAPRGTGGWRMVVGWAILGFLPSYGLALLTAATQARWLFAIEPVTVLLQLPLLLVVHIALLAMPGQRALSKLRDSAYRDTLTGIRNRAWLHDHGSAWIHAGASAVMIDVDRFKSINDGHGHEAGDAVLVALADRLHRLAAGLGGEVVRMGGDEFLALLPDEAGVAAFADGARTAACWRPAALPKWTVSVGTAACRAEDAALSEVISRADIALYSAKRRGGDSIAA